jgi:hypothetical protein
MESKDKEERGGRWTQIKPDQIERKEKRGREKKRNEMKSN